MEASIARQRFTQEVQQPDEAIDLAKAALYMAQEEYPDLDADEYLNALDTMAAELSDRLPQERYPLRVVNTINHYLFNDLQFRGNTDSYYDPRNSFLNEVIDRRTGIPITLSLVYLEIARRVDFPMVGIGMPGHFLIRPDRKEIEICVDPFHGGEVLFPEDCETRLKQIYGANAVMQPHYLSAVSPRVFLGRMLSNLKQIYLHQNNLPKTLNAIDRILLLFPDVPQEWRDRGIITYELGQLSEASQALRHYLALLPAAVDRPTILELLRRIEIEQGTA